MKILVRKLLIFCFVFLFKFFNLDDVNFFFQIDWKIGKMATNCYKHLEFFIYSYWSIWIDANFFLNECREYIGIRFKNSLIFPILFLKLFLKTKFYAENCWFNMIINIFLKKSLIWFFFRNCVDLLQFFLKKLIISSNSQIFEF